MSALVLPVIDLMNGQVVHAVRGERQNYRPLRSILCATADPYDVATAFIQKLGSTQAYVADLDAIQRQSIQWPALQAIHRAGLCYWLDVGVSEPNDVTSIAEQLECYEIENTTLMIGLETWRDPGELKPVVSDVGASRLVFSLDMRAGVPLRSKDWPADALAITEKVAAAGFERLLVLDLAQVGAGDGPSTIDLCRAIKNRWPQLQLACGGGVRNAEDVRSLSEAGCEIVLAATALHSGSLKSY